MCRALVFPFSCRASPPSSPPPQIVLLLLCLCFPAGALSYRRRSASLLSFHLTRYLFGEQPMAPERKVKRQDVFPPDPLGNCLPPFSSKPDPAGPQIARGSIFFNLFLFLVPLIETVCPFRGDPGRRRATPPCIPEEVFFPSTIFLYFLSKFYSTYLPVSLLERGPTASTGRR